MLFALLIVVAATAGCGRKASDQPASSANDAAGKAVANSALKLSEIDVSALSGVTEKLKGACARNKYGLSEEACVQTIDRRKDTCMQQTAQKYPGQLANVDRMQEVVGSHVECLFAR